VIQVTCRGGQFWQTPLPPTPLFFSENCIKPSTLFASSHPRVHHYKTCYNLRIISAMDADRHLGRPRRPNPRVKAPSDGPPQLNPVDKIINLHHGSTTAIEATPQRLQASKQYPIPSLPERIEQLQRQNSNLNHEVAYYRQMEPYRMEFQDVVTQVLEKLEKALCKLGKIQQQVNHEWT
jgi:hypothetical protein